MIKCHACSQLYNGQRGISHHVLQYSDSCYIEYVRKYGPDRRYWPDDTMLKLRSCNRCGKLLKDPRSREFCAYCKSNFYNVMKIPYVIEKNKRTNLPIKKSERYRSLISKRQKENFKQNPERRDRQRQYMLNGGALVALSGIKNPSKPQVELFKVSKEIFKNSILCFPINDQLNGRRLQYEIDIAVPDHMIAIEYDCWYWHQNKSYDKQRDKELCSLGWLVIRIQDYIPTKEKLWQTILINL